MKKIIKKILQYIFKYKRLFGIRNYASKTKNLQPKDFIKVLKKSEQRGLP
jgi:hypothetical protein